MKKAWSFTKRILSRIAAWFLFTVAYVVISVLIFCSAEQALRALAIFGKSAKRAVKKAHDAK